MASRYRHLGVGLPALLGLCLIAAGAWAHRAPEAGANRPAAAYPDGSGAGDPLDPVANGFVNRTSGSLAALMNQNAGPFSGGPEQVARAYLAGRAGDFGLSFSGADLLLDSVQEAPGGIHVAFHQGIGGVPVWRADLIVSLDASGRFVRAVSSSYDPMLAHAGAPSAPALTERQARAIAATAAGVAGDARPLGEVPSALWIVRDSDRVGSPAHLAWRIVLPVEEPLGEWEVFVGAADGTVLRLRDDSVYTDGSGFAYDPDPLTTAQVNYGCPYCDNNNQTDAELDAQRFVRTLHDLTFQNNVWNLRGPWVYLEDFESPTIPPATATDPNGFMFNRSQTGFEDVMVYFHIDDSQRYMQSLGFNNIQHGAIHADPHGLNGADNSHYLPGSNKIAYGDGGVDDAEDADVIRHEYGHAIQNSIRPGWGGGEEGAMGEGFGDYWAGSYSGSISDFHSDWVFNWDGHNTFWPGRMLTSTKHYPENLDGEVHDDGEIWSAAWWKVWREMGRNATDMDMLKHHYYMGTSATMRQAAAFAMQADKDLYQGLHSGTLNAFFTARGFFTSGQFDVPVLTTMPLGDQDGPGPYPVTVTIQSASAVLPNSVFLKFGTGQVFDQQVMLQPDGHPNEWAGSIPRQFPNTDVRYYIIADNMAGWRGATPRGAEYQYDHFHVTGLAAVDGEGAPAALALLPASPNPFASLAALRFDLPAAGPVRLVVNDVAGRRVRALVDEDLAAGRRTRVWDGRDDAGRACPAGIYIVRLTAMDRTLTRKIVMTK